MRRWHAETLQPSDSRHYWALRNRLEAAGPPGGGLARNDAPVARWRPFDLGATSVFFTEPGARLRENP